MRLKICLLFVMHFLFTSVFAASSISWQDTVIKHPSSAFKVGYDRRHNRQLYVCRTHLWGGRQLGVTWRNHSRCYVPYAKKIYVVDNYRVLSNIDGEWQPFYGFFPRKAHFFGEGVKKVPLALCRGYYHRSLFPGKTWRGHKTCEIVFHGRAISLTRYSIYTNYTNP